MEIQEPLRLYWENASTISCPGPAKTTQTTNGSKTTLKRLWQQFYEAAGFTVSQWFCAPSILTSKLDRCSPVMQSLCPRWRNAPCLSGRNTTHKTSILFNYAGSYISLSQSSTSSLSFFFFNYAGSFCWLILFQVIALLNRHLEHSWKNSKMPKKFTVLNS